MELSKMKDEFGHLAKKRKLWTSRSQEVIDQVVHVIEEALAKVQSTQDPGSPMDQKSILLELKSKLGDICSKSQLDASHKDINVALSKYPKLLEKSFARDISKVYRNVDFDYHLVNQIVRNHFYRLGLFDLGDCLINEAGEQDATPLRSQFFELHQILEAVKVKNIEPALKWVSKNMDKLTQIGTDIQLKLHKLEYIEILQQGSQTDALNYARTHLSPFASLHMDEFQKLMASLLWAGRLESSPYPEFVTPDHWEKLPEELSRLFCTLIKYPYESPLDVTVAAGGEGLPALLKLANLMAAKREEWKAMKQLSIPIDLGKQFQFHSIFICPVSKERGTEENPPMLMPCGHVLCKQSILKMAKSSTRPFKCPYCPANAIIMQCREVFF